MLLYNNIIISLVLVFSLEFGHSKVLRQSEVNYLTHGDLDEVDDLHPPENVVRYAPICNCQKNGVCKKNKNGEEECFCDPGYGVDKTGGGIFSSREKEIRCKECECGQVNETDDMPRKFGCTFETRLFFHTKRCICDAAGYYETSGKCEECNCGQRYDGVLFSCTNSSRCICGSGYYQLREKCRTANVCRFEPCLNNGKCRRKSDEDGFKCECPTGFPGKRCEAPELNPCDSNPCQNGGICMKHNDTAFECQCPATFVGKTCDLQSSPCDNKPCRNGGICYEFNATVFKCECIAPFTGDTCNTVINPCYKKPCYNNGVCIKLSDEEFECACPSPFTGKTCQDELNPCDSKPCQNGGICIKHNATSFECRCPSTFVGKTCDFQASPCDNEPCRNGGICYEFNATVFKCECIAPFTGETCNRKVSPCDNKPCENGGTCYKFNSTVFKCDCIAPFTGETCNHVRKELNPCDSKPCQNGGICIKRNATTFECQCPATFIGKTCDVEVSPCNDKPCRNGGTCYKFNATVFKCECIAPFTGETCNLEVNPCDNKPCRNGGTCYKFNATVFKCDCISPFTGETCDLELNPCDSKPCQNGGICTKHNATTFECQCPFNFIGKTCDVEVISPCDNKPCRNGGTCYEYNATAFKCECIEPFTGETCDLEGSPCDNKPCRNGGTCYKFNSTVFKCECITPFTGETCNLVINPCDKKPCDNNGVCKKLSATDFECECRSPFTGKTCKDELYPCDNEPCQNGGICIETNATTFDCQCPSTFIGKTCDVEVSPCYNKPCRNGGTCYKFNATVFKCECVAPFTGETCNLEIQTCNENLVICQNGGSCVDGGNNSFHCDCLPGYTGHLCETEINPCDNAPCGNGGTCYKLNVTAYKCECPSTFTGETCNEEIPDPCVSNPCKNGGHCIREGSTYRCSCTTWYTGLRCEDDKWCTEGEGRTLCRKANCKFHHETEAGVCTCPEGQVFNYVRERCEIFDRCPLIGKTKCKESYQICKNNACQCEENFKQSENGTCIPAFCQKKLKICASNELCIENFKYPGQVTCACREGYYFNGKRCIQVNHCDIPGLSNCTQRCDPRTKKCSCEDGFTLKADNATCELKDKSIECNLQCQPGTCVRNGEGETCVCPKTHTPINNTCIDKCTANLLPKNLCPNDECEPSEKFGFRCLCKDRYKYSAPGVTCEKKLMCSESGKKEECTRKNALCIDDLKSKAGYKCVCDNGEEEGTEDDNICKAKCDLKKYKERCADRLAHCYIHPDFRPDCKCPPGLTWGSNNKCSKLAEHSYTSWLMFPKETYMFPTRNRRSVDLFLRKAVQESPPSRVNINKLQMHLRESVNSIYGKTTLVDILKCRNTAQGLNCSIEILFKKDPKATLNIFFAPQTCLPDDTASTCVIPPNLLLQANVKPKRFVRTDPCLDVIKDGICGPETVCEMKQSGSKLSFVCSCSEKFTSRNFYTPLEDDPNTIIHICKDIDECDLGIDDCMKNSTTCVNTYGDYDCKCQRGFRLLNESMNAKDDGCVKICGSDVCVHGDCEEKGDHIFACRCHTGYYGLHCEDRLHLNLKEISDVASRPRQ